MGQSIRSLRPNRIEAKGSNTIHICMLNNLQGMEPKRTDESHNHGLVYPSISRIPLSILSDQGLSGCRVNHGTQKPKQRRAEICWTPGPDSYPSNADS